MFENHGTKASGSPRALAAVKNIESKLPRLSVRVIIPPDEDKAGMAPCLLASGERWREQGAWGAGVVLLVGCRDTCWYRVQSAEYCVEVVGEVEQSEIAAKMGE